MIRSKMMKIKPLKLSIEIEKSVRNLFKNKNQKSNQKYYNSQFKTLSNQSDTTTKNMTFMSSFNKTDNNQSKCFDEKTIKFELIKAHQKSVSNIGNHDLNPDYFSLPLLTNNNTLLTESINTSNLYHFDNDKTKKRLNKFIEIQDKINKKSEENREVKNLKFFNKDHNLKTIS